ncbi:HER037Wp [Eremothecium sinecaudum]|uniref:HER037Wp n=1 Tax=Eremothecium sinecaudum TaxID=45286 RepID=A0A120K2E7_9SACH|nr:HER037Wp [Eremothecium sinecaudum]AMD21316.1 HER037Wp [Eremothecium sinecaudum]
MSTQPVQLLEQIVKQFEDSSREKDVFFQYILATKLASNIKCLREQAITDHLLDGGKATAEYNEALVGIETENTYRLHQSKKELLASYQKYNESTRTRRYSVDFDSSPADLVEKFNSEDLISKEKVESDSVQQLRKRLLGKKQDATSTGASSDKESVEKQIQVQDELQQELLADMTQLVGSLKQGAIAFQSALQEDSTVLKATEIGLQATSKSLSALGTKLKKYNRTRVGFFFYMGCALFILLSFLATYLIIRIFPTM